MSIDCKYCKRTSVVKFGSYNGVSRYWCKNCNRKFKLDDKPFKSKISSGIIGEAITMYFNGVRVTDICANLKQQTGYRASRSGVYKWIDKYVQSISNTLSKFTINVSDRWIFDETLVFINGKKVWQLDVIDIKTRYLLATRQTATMNEECVRALIDAAIEKAGEVPLSIVRYDVTDGEEQHFDSDFKWNQIEPVHEDRSHKIDRWPPPLPDHNRPRYFVNIASAAKYNDQYMIHYNYFLPNRALDGITPAEAAGVNYPFRIWADAIKYTSYI